MTLDRSQAPELAADKPAFHGERLGAGGNVVARAFAAPEPIARGDDFHADSGPRGAMAARFA